jgi:membrane-associated protein
MFDPSTFLNSVGAAVALLIIAGIVFAESGLLVGFILPGDTLLLSAGALAAQGKLPIVLTILIISVAAIAGDNLGYQIGKQLGPRLFTKKDGLIFRQEHVEKADIFFKRYGVKAMLFAHFVPVVRSFAPIVAGVGHMDRRKFIIYDAIGDTAWAVIVTLAGFWFGGKISQPMLDKIIIIAIGGAMTLTIAPIVWHLLQRRLKRSRAKRKTQA